MKTLGKMSIIEAFKNRREPEAVHVLADTFWHALLMVCTVGVIAIIAFNFWEFGDIDRTLSIKSPSITESPIVLPFEKKDLQTILSGFERRRATYELYSSEATVVADPFEVKKTKTTR
jgi:hypothetical protein